MQSIETTKGKRGRPTKGGATRRVKKGLWVDEGLDKAVQDRALLLESQREGKVTESDVVNEALREYFERHPTAQLQQ